MREIGCCLNMLSRGSDGTGKERIAELAGKGFDYWELPLAQLMALPKSEREAALRLVESSGVPCRSCNNFFPADIRLTGARADHGRALSYAAVALDAARSFGARVVVFGSAKSRNIPFGYPPEKAWDQLADFARRLGPLARDHGITIAMEHLNRGESDMLNSFSENVRFVREVADAGVRALVDFYHLSVEKEPLDQLCRGAGLVAHAHVARLTGRTWPIAPSRDLESFFAVLGDIGYDGRISVEAYSDDPAAEAERALATLRGLDSQIPR